MCYANALILMQREMIEKPPAKGDLKAPSLRCYVLFVPLLPPPPFFPFADEK